MNRTQAMISMYGNMILATLSDVVYIKVALAVIATISLIVMIANKD